MVTSARQGLFFVIHSLNWLSSNNRIFFFFLCNFWLMAVSTWPFFPPKCCYLWFCRWAIDHQPHFIGSHKSTLPHCVLVRLATTSNLFNHVFFSLCTQDATNTPNVSVLWSLPGWGRKNLLIGVIFTSCKGTGSVDWLTVSVIVSLKACQLWWCEGTRWLACIWQFLGSLLKSWLSWLRSSLFFPSCFIEDFDCAPHTKVLDGQLLCLPVPFSVPVKALASSEPSSRSAHSFLVLVSNTCHVGFFAY